jgi:surface-anchored protein
MSLLLLSCKDDLEVSIPNFNISIDKTVFNVGDTVTFNFTGKVDYLTFYSGEDGHDYKFRDRTTISEGIPQLQFTSYAQYGAENNTLHLLASTDFTGVIDSSLVNYTWVDITNRATLSTGTDNTSSGIIDLSDFISDKPMFIAFKYNGRYDLSSAQKTWTIKNFQINYIVTSSTNSTKSYPIISSIGNAGFVSFDLENSQHTWKQTATQIQIAGGGVGTPDNLDWIITQPLFLNQVVPDKGVAISNLVTQPDHLDYVFSKPGTYDVVFVCSNATIKGNKMIEKEFHITINPN